RVQDLAFAELEQSAFVAAALPPLPLCAAQTLPGVVQLPAPELIVRVETEPVLDQRIFAMLEGLAFLGEAALFVGQLFFAMGETDAVGIEPAAHTLLEQAQHRVQALALGLELLLLLEQLALRLTQIAGHLLDVLFVGGALLLQRAAFGLGALAQAQE